jgi:medium-chain acyl-[acyl-carrier-protein] hydrolase
MSQSALFIPSRQVQRWLDVPKANPASRLRLFCFPYAGGGAQVYRAWADHLPYDVELRCIRMPGRGPRVNEPCHTSMADLVCELHAVIASELNPPFAFFGHSLGALVCFELARLLRSQHQPGPLHLFVSGRRAPQVPIANRRLYELPDAELLVELQRLNGTPREVLQNTELMRLMLPSLRADFKVHGTYSYIAEPALRSPITAFGGTSDAFVSHEQLRAWQVQTTASFRYALFPGDHFFLNDCRSLLLEEINQSLMKILSQL